MIRDRKLVPPEGPKPYTQCWHCNEDIYLDSDNRYFSLDGYACCESNDCIEAIGIELGFDEEFQILDDGYTFIEYIQDKAGEYVQAALEKADYL